MISFCRFVYSLRKKIFYVVPVVAQDYSSGCLEDDKSWALLWFLVMNSNMNHDSILQEPYSILKSVMNVSNSHENIEHISRKDVLHPDANSEGH